jgi:predicted Ser/Thr protein kinase
MHPETLGRYRIEKELGRGAMGRVFVAHDPQIDRRIAVKTIQIFSALPVAERDEAREAFLREARAAGKLIHPGIVTLFDVGETEGLLYLAMEYVEGPTLDRYGRRDRLLPVADVVALVASVAETLHYAHGAGVIHRDIKPANLIHMGGHKVKVMDFGLARPAEAQLTQDGALLGTPSYMSPEQIRSQGVDGRSDLFSLAVVLFELLTGERPFPGKQISSIIYRIVNEEPRDARELNERVTPELDGFLKRALQKDPAQRFADGAAFAAALREAAGTAAVSAGSRPAAARAGATAGATAAALPSAQATRPRRTSARPFLLAALLLIVAAAAAAYHYREQLGWFEPAEVWWETAVRVEPPEAELLLDGEPLDPAAGGVVRFRPEGPYGVLTATVGCRVVERPLGPEDAGGEVVLVVDPVEMHWTPTAELADTSVRLNGDAVSAEGARLDLCRDNTVRVEAEGFEPATVEIPAQATPLEARTLLGGVQLAEIPRGLLKLPEQRFDVVYYVDGERLEKGRRELELAAGEHEVRFKNEYFWVDVVQRIQVPAGETVAPALEPPALTELVVQAFPSNCKVYLRRPGGKWRYVDDTPSRRKVAVGRYELRVELNPTGETKDQEITLRAGENPPVRVAFGRRS